MKYPIPNDWDGETWCNWSVCWPGSPQWEALLRGFLTLPQRGWTWDERTGTVTSVQETGRVITDENLPLWRCIVSCRDDSIGDAIRYLADRVASLNFCCTDGPGPGITGGGTGGSGGTSVPSSEVDDGEPTGEPPEGFETWGEYFANKCDAATHIVTLWRADLERAQAINFYAGMTLTVLIRVLALALLSPIPGDEIVLLAATALAAIGAGLLNAVLSALEAVLSDFEAELICALYEAPNVAQAASGAYDVFADNIDTEVPLAETWALSMTRHWLTPDNLNLLFESNPDVTYEAGDCSGCDESGLYYYSVTKAGGSPTFYEWDGTLTTIDLGSGTSDQNGAAVTVNFYELDQVTKTCALTNNFVTTAGIRASNHIINTCNGSQLTGIPLAEQYVQRWTFYTVTANQAWNLSFDIERVEEWP